jgi:hypothetical protein
MDADEQRLREFIAETKLRARIAMENPPRLPWQLRVRRWFDSLGGSLDIWEVLAVVLVVRLIFG